MYKQTEQLNLPAIDREIREFWEAQNVFQKSIEQRDAQNPFVFFEGPPSANGKPGIHHVMARTVKDLFCRFQTMKGKRVERKGGWDTHGLPVELKVESELGITKEDIGKSISVAAYNQQCRETVMRFKDMWDDITRKMGYWVDLDDPYITFENDYIESVWWLLSQLHQKGLLYKGYTIQPYSPAAGTGLSSHELNLPGCYKNVKDTTVVAQFKLIREEASEFLFDNTNEDVRLLAWTTTPWTLPSNTALGVGKKITYVKVRTFNKYTGAPISVVLAEDLLSRWFKPEGAEAPMEYEAGAKLIPYRVQQQYKGAALEGLRYEQLLPYAQPEDGDAFKVLIGDFVSTEDGTGIVHLAPSFGADDRRTAQEYGIGSLTLVDKTGRFTDEAGELAGRFVKNYKDDPHWENPDIDIAVALKQNNKAFNVAKYEHNYPHCWRTDKPVLYYPLDSWFVKATAARDRMVELNQTINWKPPSTGKGRFGKWLENLQDWNLSRSRYWGIPLPIWRTADGEEERCIGSVEALKTAIDQANQQLGMNQSVPEDLHRPYIDEVVLVSADGQPMHREADLIDVWFDSGAMPYAQWHYPFENKDVFERSFPADFIAEGVDQTRGWFYTLHAIGTLVFDSVAYKNVVSNGLVLDAEGNKMSKRLGNAVDPFETLKNHGADATRWYMMANANPWDNLKFDLQGIEEVKRKFFGTLYNTYSFFSLYANIDEFAFKEERIPVQKRSEIDRWIISLLHTLVAEVEADFQAYEPTRAARKMQGFVIDNLSNWYVRLCRRRFWKGDYTPDKVAAYQTLYECLETVSKLMAPIAPFFSDWLYRNLNEVSQREPHISVHLSLFPEARKAEVDKALEERMDYAQRISSLILSLRKQANIRVRQPLSRALLPILDDQFQEQVEKVKPLILAEVNVKDLEYITDTSGVINKSIKPNFKTLGRRLGKDMKSATAAIAALDQEAIATIEETGKYALPLNGTTYDLTLEDFVITSEDIPGWQVASDGNITVALDISLNDELIAEGTARELVKHIQNIRKEQNFEVTDRVRVRVQKTTTVQPAVTQYGHYIAQETLADEVSLVEEIPDGHSVTMPDESELHIEVSRV